MAKTKQQLIVENNTQFPNNNTGFISPDKLRTFNVDMIDSMVDELTYGVYTASIAAQSASFDARIDALEGLSSSLSGSVGAISASVAALSASVLLIQDFTASADERLDDLEAFTSSYNAFSASVEAQFAIYDEDIYQLQLQSQSLNNYTASVNDKFDTLSATTASIIATASLQQSEIDALIAFTGSVGVAATGSLFASASFTNDTITFGVKATLVTTSETSEEEVYDLTKTVFENLSLFKMQDEVFKNIDAKRMATEAETAPLHPGAYKYFIEKGYIKPTVAADAGANNK
jgi:hypothetical protein